MREPRERPRASRAFKGGFVIDIIIVNYNCAARLQALLRTLTEGRETVINSRADYRITVVDNQSGDGSAAMTESQFPAVNLIVLPENDGYASAVNAGVAATSNREILLLNSDVLIEPRAVMALRRIWERLDFPGAVGPMHFEEDGFPQLTWGSFPTLAAEARRRSLDRAASERKPWARRALLAEGCRTRQVDWISGSCMFFPRSAAMDIGPWDQTFFLYFEDIDWCLRAREKGYAVYHTPEAGVVHAHGASTGLDPDDSEIEYRHSQMYFVHKHLGRGALWRCRLHLTGKMLGRWLAGGRSGFERGTSLRIARDVWRKPGA